MDSDFGLFWLKSTDSGLGLWTFLVKIDGLRTLTLDFLSENLETRDFFGHGLFRKYGLFEVLLTQYREFF